MSILIQLKSVHKSYGDLVLFDEATCAFGKGDKIGVIGRNGAGKSTLCKLITGEEEPDAGQVTKSTALRLSYLEQASPFSADEQVLPFLARYTGKEDWECGKVAGRFQLKNEILETRIGDLPGGYQTRVKLTAMLLRDPNFLILDEPTNYLDLRTLLILERFLREFSGGFLVVSHDREFLKKTCQKTLEVERGRCSVFSGDIEAYLAYKEERIEQDVRYNKNVEAKRKHLQEFVNRYRVRAATASRAQSKLKQMERLTQIEVEHPLSRVRIRLPRVEPKQGVVLGCTGLSIGYPDNEVARDIQFEIERGQHVAVLGDNGEGKTTFLRTIAGHLDRRAGEFKWGYQLKTAYYAQHVYASLDPKLDVLSYLQQEAAPEVVQQDVLDLAGSFLFGGDDVLKPISVLSGGERARVCLAGILLSKRPILLLDEPTNHLDFETVEALAHALNEYAGTIFFVSHDRTFVNLVATSIVEVKSGSVTLYPDNYESYVYRTEREVDETDPVKSSSGRAGPSHGGGLSYEQRKGRRSRINKLKRLVERLEKEIADYEREREAINRHYLENPTDPAPEKRRRLGEINDLVPSREEEWLQRQEELQSLIDESEE